MAGKGTSNLSVVGFVLFAGWGFTGANFFTSNFSLSHFPLLPGALGDAIVDAEEFPLPFPVP